MPCGIRGGRKEKDILADVPGKSKNPERFRIRDFWRRRRDLNPRDPFGAYTISNRARSAGLRDFSICLSSVVSLSLADNDAIIASPGKKSRGNLKKFKNFFRAKEGPGGPKGSGPPGRGRERQAVTDKNCVRRWCSKRFGRGPPRNTW